MRTSTRPEPDLDLHEGRWVRLPSVPPTTIDRRTPPGSHVLTVRPDVGTAAWIDCAGHLPWGLSGDQRLDDARSLTWDLAPPTGSVVGHPVLRLRISADRPAASISVKLCDVFPDGTSALVTRGTLDLAFRSSVHGEPVPLEPGTPYDVEVELDACAYEWVPGQTLRVSVAGSDWPSTVAPPTPVTLTVHAAELVLPVLVASWPEPAFAPGATRSTESSEGVAWEIHDDVLARVTTARTQSVSEYETPYYGRAREGYRGEVSVDRRTFAQRAHADTTYELGWPGVEIRVWSVMDVTVEGGEIQTEIRSVATLDGEVVSDRSWVGRSG